MTVPFWGSLLSNWRHAPGFSPQTTAHLPRPPPSLGYWDTCLTALNSFFIGKILTFVAPAATSPLKSGATYPIAFFTLPFRCLPGTETLIHLGHSTSPQPGRTTVCPFEEVQPHSATCSGQKSSSYPQCSSLNLHLHPSTSYWLHLQNRILPFHQPCYCHPGSSHHQQLSGQAQQPPVSALVPQTILHTAARLIL